MDAKKRVKKWLEYCESNKIKPWKFDFKQCYIKEKLENSKYGTSNLRLEIAYKRYLLQEINDEFNVTNKTGENADCDKEALPMYKVLDWHKSKDGKNIHKDTMNSFQTTFTPLLAAPDNKTQFRRDNRYIWLKILKNDSLPDVYCELEDWTKKNNILYNLRDFIEIHYESLFNNSYKSKEKTEFFLVELEKFAGLTSSIGNFIVLPKKFKTVDLSKLYYFYGQRKYNDYWDCALKNLHEKFFKEKQGSTLWRNFIEKYYLQPFVDEDYAPKELWKGHFKKGSMPKKIGDFEQFYHNVNPLIEERGKKITEELYKKVYSSEELKECTLYQNELANFEPRDFNKITKVTLSKNIKKVSV